MLAQCSVETPPVEGILSRALVGGFYSLLQLASTKGVDQAESCLWPLVLFEIIHLPPKLKNQT